jgi:hypothetical protein
MAFAIMCDDKVIATSYKENGVTPMFKLEENTPQIYVPLGLFNNSIYESGLKVLEWFEDRAFPEERTDCKELLEDMDLDRYDAWNIIKQTRGTLMTDYFWLRIKETDTYEEFSLRGQAGIPPTQF